MGQTRIITAEIRVWALPGRLADPVKTAPASIFTSFGYGAALRPLPVRGGKGNRGQTQQPVRTDISVFTPVFPRAAATATRAPPPESFRSGPLRRPPSRAALCPRPPHPRRRSASLRARRRTPAAVFSAVFAGEYSAAFLFVFAGTMDVFGG